MRPAVLLAAFGLVFLPPVAEATPCGQAQYQLQAYVSQVNQIANFEYWQGIPARCGPNIWCTQTLLQQLNHWYAQEGAKVNSWYGSIATTCTTNPAPPEIEVCADDEEAPSGLEENEIEDLEMDDADRLVRIRIPESPRGFSPSRRPGR